MGISINKSNYAYWKRIASIVYEEMESELSVPLKPEDRPMAILDAWEQRSEVLARRGLREGLQDLVSELKYCSEARLGRMDQRLKDSGLPGVLALQAIAKKTLEKVLKSGRIRSMEDYYVVKDRLDDMTFVLSTEDRTALTAALADFGGVREE